MTTAKIFTPFKSVFDEQQNSNNQTLKETVDEQKATVAQNQKKAQNKKNSQTLTVRIPVSKTKPSAPVSSGPASVGAEVDRIQRSLSPVPQIRSPRFRQMSVRSRGFVGIPVDSSFDSRSSSSLSPFSNSSFRSGSRFTVPLIGAGASSGLTPIERAAGKNALSFNKGPVKSSGYDDETKAFIQKGIEKAAKDGYFGAELLGKGSVTSVTMRIDTHRFRDLNGKEHETHKERNSTDIRHLLTNYLPQNKREYYYYLLGKEGKPAAEKYLDQIKINDMEKPVMASVSEGRAKKFAEDHPFIERAARIALGPAGAFEGAYNLLGSALGRSDSSTTGKFEPSDSVSSAKRGFTAAENEWIDKNTGGASWFFKAGNAGANMILDTLWLTPLGAAGKAAEGTKYAGKIIKGIHDTALFSQMFNDELGGQVAAGTSDKPGAFLSASVKSGLQALSFSKMSNFNSKLFGKLGKTSAGLKRFALNVSEATLNGAGINASQTFLGQVADLAIRGPFSDFSSAKQAYLDSGLSEKDATSRAVYDTLISPTIDSAVTGGLISAFYALPESASRMMAFIDHGRRVRSTGYDYIGDGLSLEESSAAHQFAQKLVKYADEGKPITDNMIGVSAWLNEVEHANRNEYISTIEGLTGTKVKVGFTSDPDKFNADLTPDDDIIVQPDTEHGFENSVRHETSHLIERYAPEEYTVFRDLLQGVEGRDAAIARIQDNYFRQTGKQQSVKAAEAELAADYSMRLGNKPDLERISRIVNERPAAADRAYNAIRWLEGHLLGGKTFVDEATGLRLTNKEAYELSRAYEKAFVKAAENVRDGSVSRGGETLHSVKSSSLTSDEIYDYTKPFSDQLDDWKLGKVPKRDSLLIGGTPDVYKKIGFNALPFTINQVHIDYALNGTKDIDHSLGEAVLKQLPSKLKEPVAVISSATHRSTRLVVLLDVVHNNKTVILPVEIDGHGHLNNIRIDSNSITSAFGKDNAVTKLLKDAIDDEQSGKIAVYYLNNKKTAALLQSAGLQLPGGLFRNNGYIHSIREKGSPVKSNFENITYSQQFKRWFGDWEKDHKNASKVVNEDGTPKVMYRGGQDESFTVFDRKKSKYTNLYGRGFYFTDSPDVARQYGDVRQFYLDIKNPLMPDQNSITKPQLRKFLEAVADNDDYDIYNYGTTDVNAITDNIYGKNDFAMLQDISATAIGDLVEATELFNDVNGTNYDGFILPSEIVAFYPTQIKSATDNIGTFDKSDPDILHSTRTVRPYGLNARDEVRAFTSDKAVDKEFRQYLRITVADLVQKGFHALDSGDTADGRLLLHDAGEIIEQHIRGQNSAGIADDFTETMINTFNGKKQNAIMEGRDIEGINDINNYGISVNSLMLGLDLQRGLSPDTDTEAAKAHIRNAFTMANDNADRADIHNELRQAADIIVSGENRSFDDPASRNTAVNELASDLYNAYRDSQRAGMETDPDIIAADNAKYGRNIEGSFRDLLDAGNLKEGDVRGLSELTRRSIDTLYSGESDISNIRQDINKTIADLLYGHGHSDLEKQQITSTVINNVLETSNSLMSKEQARLNDLINSEITSGRAESELARQARADLADLKERIGALVQFDNSVNGVWKLSKAFTNTLMNPFNTSNQVEMFERMSEFTYQNEDNRTQYEKAKRELTERGIDRSITELMNKSKWEGSDNIKAFILSTYLGKLGMHREAVDLLVIYSQRNREAGRLVQSNMVAKLMTPEGRVMKFERDYTEALRAQYEYMHGKEAADLFSRNLEKARSIDNERRAAADDMLTRNFAEHRQAKENIENTRSDFLENSNDLADTISQLNENKSRSDILRERVGKHFGKIRGFLFSVKQSGEDNRNIYPIFEEFARLYNRVAQIETDMNRDITSELSDAPNDQQRENIINNLMKSYSLDEGFDYTRLYEQLDGMRRDMLQRFLDSHDVGYISPDELMNYGRWQLLDKKLRSLDGQYSDDPSDARSRNAERINRTLTDRANTRDQLINALKAEGFSGDEIRDMWNEHGSMDLDWVNYEILRSRLHKSGYTDIDISEIEAQNDGMLTPEIVDPLLYPDTPRFDPDMDQTSTLPDLDETEVSAALEELDSIYKRAAELDEERVKLEDRSGELAAMLNTANEDMARVIEAAMLRIQEGAKADDIEYNELSHADLFGLNYAVDSYLKRAKIGYIPEAERSKMKEWIFKIAACNSPDELLENILDLSAYRNTATFNKRGIEKKLRRIYQDFEPLYEDNPSRGDKVDILKDIAFQQIVGAMADRTQSTRAKKARSLHFAVQLLGVPTFMRNIGSEVLMGIPETAVNNLAAVIDSGYALGKTALQMLNGKRTVWDINTDTFGEAFRKNRNFGFESLIIGLPRNLKSAAKRSRESFIETALNVNLIGRDRTRFGKDIAYKRSFTKGPGAVMERALGYSLSVTDEAIKGYYIEQVRNSLKNTGLSDAEIEAEARAAADYRVFQNDSLVGITLEKLRKAANNIGFGPRNEDGVKEFGLGDFITTYTFVPGAVATRAFEYSPLGYSKALYMAYKMFHNAYGSAKADGSLKAASGKKVRFSENIRNTFSHISRTDARQTLLAFLRPVTGQGMIAAGALLRSKGIIIGTSQTNSYNQSLYEKSKNLGDFRINLSQLRRLINGEADDDTSHDDDLIADMVWIVPANTTLSIGADMYDRVGAAGFKIFAPGYLGDLITSSSNLASESLEDLAMWSSVNSIFQNRKNTNSVPEFLAAEGADMIFSFMPSLIRQIGGALDPYERDPYKSSSVSELFFNKVRANIPFVREGVPLSIDSFGQVRERSIGNRVADFFSSGVSPSRLYRYRENELTDELDRIAKQDPSVLPTSPYRDQAFELNGQEYKFKLADEEYQQYAQMQGKLWYKTIHSFYEDPDYNRLSDSMKINVLNDIKNDVVYHAAREIWVGYQTGKGEGDLTKIENDVIKKYRDAATNKILNIQANDYLNQDGVNTEDVIDAGYYEPYTEAEKKEQIAKWQESIEKDQSYIQKILNGTFYNKSFGGYSRYWSAEQRAAKIKEYQDWISTNQRSIEDVSSGAKQKWHKVTGAFSQLSDQEKAAVVSKMEREPGAIHLPDEVRNNKPDFSNAGPSVIDVSKSLVDRREPSTVVGSFLDPTKWDTRRYDSGRSFEQERLSHISDSESAESADTSSDSIPTSQNSSGNFSRSYKGFYRYKRKRKSYRRRSKKRRSYKRRGGSRVGGKSRSRLPYINSNALGSGSYNNRSGGLSRFGNRFGRGGSSRFTGSAAFGDSSSSRIPIIGGDQRKRGWKY